MGIQISTAIIENSVEVSQALKLDLVCVPVILMMGIHQNEMKSVG